MNLIRQSVKLFNYENLCKMIQAVFKTWNTYVLQQKYLEDINQSDINRYDILKKKLHLPIVL